MISETTKYSQSKMKNIMVSAIITTYKREPSVVKRALTSIINQTYTNLEIIVVDDSPESYEYRCDVEKTALSLCDSVYKIKYIKHEKSMGACVARNTGISNATGDYIAFLDDDDEWVENKIERQLTHFTSEKIGLVYCSYLEIDDETGARKIANHSMHKGKVFDSLIMENYMGGVSCPLIRKKCLDDICGFDPRMKSAQDLDIWLRIAKQFEVDYVDAPLVLYHIHAGEQITKNPYNKISGLERIIEKNIEYLQKHNKAYSIRLLKIVPFYSMIRQKRYAFVIWVRAIKLWPWSIINNIHYLAQIIKK